MMARLASLVLLLAPASALAADGIVITRGADSEVFGNCVPSLKVENRSGETVGYLEVDIALALSSGQTGTVELQSAYRGGISFPIAPGGTALLKQHLDLSPALGASCQEVKARSVARTICETADGKACAVPLSVTP